jgi:uncharacterized protein (DUF2132 family)
MTIHEIRFDGDDYIPARDDARLKGQLLRVWNVVQDGGWYTLAEIAKLTTDPEASISAQLRHLRKPRFGNHEIEKEYIGNGCYKYRLIENVASGWRKRQIERMTNGLD